jgi:hypothetical protein
MQVAIGVFVIAINLLFYWLAFRRPRRTAMPASA